MENFTPLHFESLVAKESLGTLTSLPQSLAETVRSFPRGLASLLGIPFDFGDGAEARALAPACGAAPLRSE